MNIGITVMAQILMVWIPVATFVSYILGKRKTESPKTTAFIGFLLSFIPPFSIIFLIILLLKRDMNSNVSVA